MPCVNCSGIQQQQQSRGSLIATGIKLVTSKDDGGTTPREATLSGGGLLPSGQDQKQIIRGGNCGSGGVGSFSSRPYAPSYGSFTPKSMFQNAVTPPSSKKKSAVRLSEPTPHTSTQRHSKLTNTVSAPSSLCSNKVYTPLCQRHR